jgi:catechol 2,3-dioxygenase-like lactoylglutathione lyase family enzyme
MKPKSPSLLERGWGEVKKQNNNMKKLFKFLLITILTSLLYTSLTAQVKEIGAVGITVSNMEQSVKFYSQVLGFKKISDIELAGTQYEKLQGIFGLRMRIVRMQLGDEYIDLTDYLTSGGRSIPENANSNDLIFQHIAVVVSDMDKAYQHLRKYMVMHVSTGPQTIPKSNTAAVGVKAFYFHDPDMHNLELIYFPKGKGQAKWQAPKGKLFLGIDHTAIAVSNTDSSLYFYEDLLGIMRKGDSWNMGMEQAHLNFVEGASLHITGLRAAKGPGIEFLEYLAPGPGKYYPADSKTDDIWHWQTTLFTDDAEKLYKQFAASEYKIVSKELVDLQSKNGRHRKAFIVRDRDGHAMLIVEEIQ